jgi:hypothetical protein
MDFRIPKGIVGPTITKTSTNASKNLVVDDSLPTSLDAQGMEGASLSAVVISVATHEIRFSFTTDASNTHGHILDTLDALVIEGSHAIRQLEYASETTNEHGVLMITPIYSTGSLK